MSHNHTWCDDILKTIEFNHQLKMINDINDSDQQKLMTIDISNNITLAIARVNANINASNKETKKKNFWNQIKKSKETLSGMPGDLDHMIHKTIVAY